jgi:hypothetical protein
MHYFCGKQERFGKKQICDDGRTNKLCDCSWGNYWKVSAATRKKIEELTMAIKEKVSIC